MRERAVSEAAKAADDYLTSVVLRDPCEGRYQMQHSSLLNEHVMKAWICLHCGACSSRDVTVSMQYAVLSGDSHQTTKLPLANTNAL